MRYRTGEERVVPAGGRGRARGTTFVLAILHLLLPPSGPRFVSGTVEIRIKRIELRVGVSPSASFVLYVSENTYMRVHIGFRDRNEFRQDVEK